MEIIELCLAVTAFNAPFGFYRAGARKYSWQWFLAIHLPVPFIIAMRLLSGHGWNLVPVLIACAVIGQLIGGLFRSSIYNQKKPAE